MTRLGPDQVAFFVRAHQGELTRIWREARAIARPRVFPGLIDGVVESFFDTCGAVLAAGGRPEEVWPALRGVVRRATGHVPGEVHREWALLWEVLAAATEAVSCDEDSREWLKGAATDCRYGTASLISGLERCPPELLVAVVLSPFVTPRVRQERRETDA